MGHRGAAGAHPGNRLLPDAPPPFVIICPPCAVCAARLSGTLGDERDSGAVPDYPAVLPEFLAFGEGGGQGFFKLLSEATAREDICKITEGLMMSADRRNILNHGETG